MFFQGRVYGTSDDSGLWFPDFADVAKSFDMAYHKINTTAALADFSHLLRTPGPMIIDCNCVRDQEIIPAQALKNGKQAGLHDMYPFLSDDELAAEMIVKI